MQRLLWLRAGACLLLLCTLACASGSAFAQTPDAIRTALSKVEPTGKGPYSDTVFQKNIPLNGKSPMPGSAWRMIWNGLPKPQTKAVVDAGDGAAGGSGGQRAGDAAGVRSPARHRAGRGERTACGGGAGAGPVVAVQPMAAPISDAVVALRNGGVNPPPSWTRRQPTRTTA